jgi:MOSC domain-containing protein YiiM
MDPVESATLVARHGIEGNADVGGKRQVTIISRDRWDRVDAELGTTVDPALRRANILVSGIDLSKSGGKVLGLGTCRIHIHGETTPCSRMDEEHRGLREALMADWGGGAYGEIVEGGEVTVGDEVAWLDGQRPTANRRLRRLTIDGLQ